MSKEWNARQREAIDIRGKSIVVSAAAGSGKTSVLAERVLRLIEEGEDIESMLIVTFTNLAAGEMKERIYKRLQEAGSPKLAAQAEKCAFADISTIHSFCGRVIRDNFEHAGVSPSFAVADEAAITIMRQRAMDEALTVASEEEKYGPFFSKFSNHGDLKALRETVFAIYDRITSLKDPGSWLESAESNFDSDGFILVLFKEFKHMLLEAMNKAAASLEERADLWEIRGFTEEALLCEEQLKEMVRLAQKPDIKNLIIPHARYISSPVKGAPNRESATLTDRANKCFAGIEQYEGDFEGKVKTELIAEREDALLFIELTRKFSKLYSSAKKQKNLLDHDDMLHYALKVLSVPDIAQRYKNKYSHVFVDEYQDINEIQDAILKQVIRGDNDFLVGDVKQCIYIFRESNPDLLIARCAELKESGLIEMNFNYRSEPGVISFINGIMGTMMNAQAGGVDYSGGQVLECAKEGVGAAEIILAGGEDTDGLNAEAAAIASYISKLVSEGFRYKDIAVLRPEVATTGKQLAKALSDLGVPVTGGSESGGESGETAVFINLLSLIDSPVSDVAALSVMRYPHFGFTEPEFARIRINAKDEEDLGFCKAVLSFDEDSPLGEKIKAFLKEIEHYRVLSQSMKLPDFLQRLRQEAEFSQFALTSPGGKGSDAALGAFINAVSSGGAECISGVLEMAGKTAATRQLRPGETDAVFLTTIHKSKGLEFPAVILSGMHKKINQRDTYGPVLVGRSLGLAADAIDGTERIRKKTLHMKAVARGMQRETISESIRLLYVGMTRAISRLVIVGAGTEIKEKWLQKRLPGWQHDASTYFDLIMGAASDMCIREGMDIYDIVSVVSEAPVSGETSKEQRLNSLLNEAEGVKPLDMFERYEYETDLGVPSKVSVSALKELKNEKPKEWIKPVSFEEPEGLTAAEKGTLTHKVLQKMDLRAKTEDDIKAEINKLEETGIIEKNMGAYVNAVQLETFLNSPLAGRAGKSAKLLREAPFCIRVPARETGISDSGEGIIVQGVIDMCFLEDGQWIIVDYKTDRVDTKSAPEAALKYSVQIEFYKKALESITKIKVKEKIIYFLSADCVIEL